MERKVPQTTKDNNITVSPDVINLMEQLSYVMTQDMIENPIRVKQILDILPKDKINILDLSYNKELLNDVITSILQTTPIPIGSKIRVAMATNNKKQLVIYYFMASKVNQSRTIENNIKYIILTKYSDFKELTVKQFKYHDLTDINTMIQTDKAIMDNIKKNSTSLPNENAMNIANKTSQECTKFDNEIVQHFKILTREFTSSEGIINMISPTNATIPTLKKKLLAENKINAIKKAISSFKQNIKDMNQIKGFFTTNIKQHEEAISVLLSNKKISLKEGNNRTTIIKDIFNHVKNNYNETIELITKLELDLLKLKALETKFEKTIQEEKEAKELEKTQKLDTEKIPNITETVQNDQKIKVEQQLANLQKRYYQEEFKEEEKEEEIINDVDVNIKIAEGKITKLQFKNNELEGFSDDIFAAKIDNPLNANAKIYVVCENKEHQQFFKEITTGANKILPQGSTGHSGFKIANQNSAYFKINRTKNDMSNIDTTKRLSFQIEYLKVNNETVMILTNPSIANKKDTDDMWKESEQPKLNTKTINSEQSQKK